ncbi:MAG: thiamine pyrophosphate-dependent enzyme [Bacteroidales bacterium]|nr:thiamine pyrophosphate-dependent enzyme [Clostridium sp.]MCM1202868.1 thiamine pyrophosphate-dependent enzyme [Bacteroidales bacterium]
MEEQQVLFESGNELAAYAAKQINYHVMGYYPITPSTQIAELLDSMKADGEHDISLIAAEGEHSAAGICYGAATGGGRVFNATSANGLLYALEQLPVQSGTRFPMVMNVACRTVSGPLSIKGDHSDIMYTLNTGWLILFANTPQEVYDFNLCALKIAERVKLPVIVAFDGFFTSHQKRNCMVFKSDETVKNFIGEYRAPYSALDLEHPVSIGSYMNEPDILNNKYQLHLAMEEAHKDISEVFDTYQEISGRHYRQVQGYRTEDAKILLYILGSAYHTARVAVDKLRKQGKRVGVFTTKVLRPYPAEELADLCKNAETIIVADRQDSYGAGGGNLSIELKAMLQERQRNCRVITRIYGLGGKDFYEEDAKNLFRLGDEEQVKAFDYTGIYPGNPNFQPPKYFAPITGRQASPGCTTEKGGRINEVTAMPKRLAPGHGACPGCGIPVNVNLLLKGIEGNVVLLFHTGCGMVVTTAYPKTAFKVPYVHNLFQNGAATLSGLVEMFHQRQKRGEYPEGEITFIMVSGDGGMDIGMGSALGTAIRNERLIIFEYDNGGYMNTGYQLSYSTPKGAKSATSHVGENQYGKRFFHKDSPMIMAAANLPYVATVAESNPADFIRKAAKAKSYANEQGTAYLKALSACPLNWNDKPNTERSVIAAAVDSCYFPLFEIENGITALSYNPEKMKKKIPVLDWLALMGRTKHLEKERYRDIVEEIQAEVDRRWERLKARAENPLL